MLSIHLKISDRFVIREVTSPNNPVPQDWWLFNVKKKTFKHCYVQRADDS